MMIAAASAVSIGPRALLGVGQRRAGAKLPAARGRGGFHNVVVAKASKAKSKGESKEGAGKGGKIKGFDGKKHAELNPHRQDDACEIVYEDFYGPIAEVMTFNVESVKPGDTLDSIVPLFEKYTGLPVVDEEKRVVGVVSEKDVVITTEEDGAQTVGEVMTTPALCIKERALIAYAAGLMLQHKVHRLPVVDKDGKLQGIVSHEDLFTPLLASSEQADPLYVFGGFGKYN